MTKVQSSVFIPTRGGRVSKNPSARIGETEGERGGEDGGVKMLKCGGNCIKECFRSTLERECR